MTIVIATRSQQSDGFLNRGPAYGVRPTFRGPPAQGCNMCQDVAHTFRSQFPCPGNKDASMSFYVRRAQPSPKKSPDFYVVPTANTCGHVGNCNLFRRGPRRTACLALKAAFQTTSRRVQIAQWFKQRSDFTEMNPKNNIGNIKFETASKAPYEAPGWFAHEYCRTANFCGPKGECKSALEDGQCRDDPLCPEAWKACGTECAACYWVIRTFPDFRRACAILNPPAALKGNTGLRKSNREGTEPVPRGLNSPPLEDEDNKVTDDFDRLSQCFDMWNEFSQSPKARYLLQYADRFGHLPWHPKLACQCLGKCVMDGFESLAMHSACAYHENYAVKEMLFPDLTDNDFLSSRVK